MPTKTESVLDELKVIYEDPARTYHNLDHIQSMLVKLTESERYAVHPHRIILAIWFHDAVYDPTRNDNEVKSAEYWMQKMTPLVLDEVLIWGKMAILATINHFPNPDPDIQLLLDLDLSGLGSPWETFMAQSEAIRQEYIHVPDDLFRKGRAEFLQNMLTRHRIFGTEYWHNKLEEQARANMQRAIKCLTE